MTLPAVIAFAHSLVRGAVRPGDMAVDATMGNGHDTLFLAELVGGGGHVYAFDVQEAAVVSTLARLKAAGVAAEALGGAAAQEQTGETAARVTLLLRDHAELDGALPPAAHGRVGAVMFNLGYLPGGDRSIITRPPSTLRALSAAAKVLRPGGIICAVVYPGHAGGAEEAAAVQAWASALPIGEWQAAEYRFLNTKKAAPFVVAAQRRNHSEQGR